MSGSIEFQNILNFRDVGKTVNGYLGQRLIREGLFYRSAKPDDAFLDDREVLRDNLGIKNVIDLRTNTEHVNGKKRREIQRKSVADLQSNAALSEPLHIDGVTYEEIKITGRPFERFLLSQLSWGQFFRLVFLFVFGYRIEAISILGKEVMQPRGMAGLTTDMLDQSGTEIRQILSLYTSTDSLPSVVHCTQGKDRTGLICALILMILDAPVPAIEHDYSLTDDALTAEREERLVEIRSIGLTDDWAWTDKGMITRMKQHLQDKYGGLDEYLDSIKFGKNERVKIREVLLY